MIRRKLFVFALLAGILAAGVGCIPSDNALYTEKDVVFDPALLGAWENELAQTQVVVTKEGEKGYKVLVLPASSQKSTETLLVHLVELGGFRFLDIEPVAREGAPEYGKKAKHFFAWLYLEEDSLGVSPLNKNWTRKTVEEKKADLAFRMQGDEMVLTAETPELQEFVVKYAEDAGAFPNAMGFLRSESKE